MMKIRSILAVAALALTVAACSSSRDSSVYGEGMEGGQSIPQGYQVQEEVVVVEEEEVIVGPTPGSQQDLKENVGDRVYFAFDKASLSAEARRTLDGQARWMQQHPQVHVTIEGHTDERGTREYNLALGERRANAVRDYLIGLGVAPARIDTVSFGKERPADPAGTPDAWARNRRAVTMVD